MESEVDNAINVFHQNCRIFIRKPNLSAIFNFCMQKHKIYYFIDNFSDLWWQVLP